MRADAERRASGAGWSVALQRLVDFLWRMRFRLGPLRGPVERTTEELLTRRGTVLTGPLRGQALEGSAVELLGIYELHVQRIVTDALEPGDVFFDVGAHRGYFSLLAARHVGEDGGVCAFEPLPENVERARALWARNGVSGCRLVPRAVGRSTGTRRFFRCPSDDRRGSLAGRQDSGTFPVETIRLDDFVASTGVRPALVKVDVEGAEVEVLAGSASLLAAPRPPVWIVEVHDPTRERQVRGMLEDAGYRVRVLPSPRLRHRPHPRHLVGRRA